MRKSFSIAIARLLEHASIILKALQTDLQEFTTFDPDLNETLVSELDSQYHISLSEGGDSVARGVLGLKTQSLLAVIKECDTTVKSLRYWVKKAFANDPASLKRFNLTGYWKIRNKQAELITYMNTLATVVESLASELSAVNAPVELLETIKPLATALEEANSDQENEKGIRSTAAQERTERLNALHANCVKFSDAAEYIFTEQPAKRELYRIPGNSSPSIEDEERDLRTRSDITT